MNFRLYHHPLSHQRCSYYLRRLSSTSIQGLTAEHSIYVSNSNNPYFNLTLEDWLFRNKDHDEPLLLLYRDEPCVVIGRNQNPWKEVNLQLAALRRVPFLRRRSGGGTVYHDLGNTNYSLHLPRTGFDRNETAKIVVRGVRSLGANAYVNDRNDICVDGFKISCSAYKIASKRAYHHGTMLISTKLDTLGDLLHITKETMVTKGVASVRSPVQNLQRFNPAITHEGFVEASIQAFQEAYGIDEKPHHVEETGNILNAPEIRKGMEELKSWDWQYGQTPEFTYSVSRLFDFGLAKAEITSKHGVILSCKVDCPGVHSETLSRINQRMIDMRYGFIKGFEEIDWDGENEWKWNDDDGDRPLRIKEIWNWIREETSS
ncbi:hypothetical protein ACEPAI_5719 [Sanghuangporus weigelae]